MNIAPARRSSGSIQSREHPGHCFMELDLQRLKLPTGLLTLLHVLRPHRLARNGSQFRSKRSNFIVEDPGSCHL